MNGRKNIFHRLEESIGKNQNIIWFHCASLGEFEQGRPVIEELKARYKNYKILLTFFSPSGYEVQKDYKEADWVFYLPLDGRKNAKRFLSIVQPALVIFVKYEFWYYYLKQINKHNTRFLLISAQFKKDSLFQRIYGSLLKKMLSRFDHLFVQTEESREMAVNMGLADICTVSGDTRFDRVIAIAEKFEPIPLIEKFIGENPVVIAGSTWPEDEVILQKSLKLLNKSELKLIIAPHEINEKKLADLQKLFPDSILYSKLKSRILVSASCLIIDNVGMLSRLYKYGTLTYVGGGITKNGVHNVLEAAVYNKIVLFGPFYEKYSEAIGLLKSGGAISFIDKKKDGIVLSQLIETLLSKKDEFDTRSKAAGEFVQSNKGATQKIIQFIQENRLLTN